MVRVKRGGKWVTVNPGQSVGKVSVPSNKEPSGYIKSKVIADDSKPKPSGTVTSRVIADESPQAQQAQQQNIQAAQQQAEQEKRNELAVTRQERISQLQEQNRMSGIRSSIESSTRIILAREAAQIKQAGLAAASRTGPTGEVTAAPPKSLPKKIISKVRGTTKKTIPPSKEVTEVQKVKGGRLESRVKGRVGGIKDVEVIFVPDKGSEREATQEEIDQFREKQSRVLPISEPTDFIQKIQRDVDTRRKIIETRNLREQRTPGFKDIGEQIFIGGFGAGVATSALGTASFVKNVVTDPIGTSRATKQGLIQLSYDIPSGKTFRDIGSVVKTSPGFALGFVGAEVGTSIVGGRLVGSVSGVRRIAERKALKNIGKAKTAFISQADGDIIRIVAETKIGRQSRFTALRGKITKDLLTLEGVVVSPGKPRIKFPSGKIKFTEPKIKRFRSISASKELGKGIKVVESPSIKLVSPKAQGLGGAGFSQIEGLQIKKALTFGKATRIPETSSSIFRGGIPKKIRIYGKEGKLSVLPESKLTGVITEKSAKAGTFISAAEPSSQVVKSTTQQVGSLTEAIKQLEISKLKSVSSPKIITPPAKFKGMSQQLEIKTEVPKLDQEVISISAQDIKQDQILKPKIETDLGRRTRSRQGTAPQLALENLQKSDQETKLGQITQQDQDVSQKSKLDTMLKFKGPVKPTPITPFISIPKGPPKIPVPKPKTLAPIMNTGRLFGVQVRRFGKFISAGKFRTQAQAFERGREVTSRTLAATFRLTSPGRIPKATKGFRRKTTKMGTLFIEKRGKRLSKKSETKEIQLFKGRAPKKVKIKIW